ncbi:MAG: PilN domain-containing protein [Gammaproteobacteria bacterium]|nr:PilN domain-containing protein [Gammaproteobacteria bacterium]
MTQINLLPWREKARKKLKINLGILFAMGISVTLFIIIIFHLLLSGLINRENARGDFLQTAVNERSALYQAEKAKKKKQDAMELELSFLYNLRSSSYHDVQLLNQLTTLVPATIVLDQVAKTGHKIVIVGRTQAELEITLFMKNITQSKYFNQPVLTRISQTPDKIGASRIFELQVEQKGEGS